MSPMTAMRLVAHIAVATLAILELVRCDWMKQYPRAPRPPIPPADCDPDTCFAVLRLDLLKHYYSFLFSDWTNFGLTTAENLCPLISLFVLESQIESGDSLAPLASEAPKYTDIIYLIFTKFGCS